MAKQSCDLLKGMKAICEYLNVSESTALKFHRELDMPIRKGSKNGDTGIWLGSKRKIDDWSASLAA